MKITRIAIGIVLLASLTACQGEPEVVFESPPKSSLSSSVSSLTTNSSAAAASSPGRDVPAAEVPAELPASVLIRVPFASQAPFANWDALHEETCEEASLILVRQFLRGESITEQQMEDQLQELVAWETANGYGYDVTVTELRDIARDHYRLNGEIITDISADNFERILSEGHPIIIPAAGRDLGNPYFSGEGPWYHMLVVIGYDDDEFITNDVGTKRGASYRYDKNVLIEAVHDWTGIKEETNTGTPRALVIR